LSYVFINKNPDNFYKIFAKYNNFCNYVRYFLLTLFLNIKEQFIGFINTIHHIDKKKLSKVDKNT